MKKIRRFIALWKLLSRNTRGVSAIEYVVIATGTAAFVVLAWTIAGGNISTMFTTVQTTISGTASTTGTDDADSGGSDQTASSDDDSDSDFSSDDDSSSSGDSDST